MKLKRQSKIIELVKKGSIETQEELSEMLRMAGFDVTQATISRDIRELKLTKISDENGKQRYAVLPSMDTQFDERFIRIFKDGVLSIDYAQNIIMIKTLEGMAMAVAAALDSMTNIQIMGSIAGDDTIMCVVKTEELALDNISKLLQIIKKDK